jgi:DsbC/DsbD-like thiol-disulfide interchange protein
MKPIHHLLTAFGAVLFLTQIVVAQQASLWVGENAYRTRLVAGQPVSGELRAGLEIRLEPGWKTYWINPGPTGLPPRLDFSGSSNLKSAEPLWPAPMRFVDGVDDAVGYSGAVIVPLRLIAQDADKPVYLKAVLDYGVCEKICIPVHAELEIELDLATQPDALAALQIKGFEKRVPVQAKLGGNAPLAITALARTEQGLGVSVRFPDGAKVMDLFASSPDGPVPVPEKTAPGIYRIGLKDTPPRLNLIAVADGLAIKVPVALDGLAPKP